MLTYAQVGDHTLARADFKRVAALEVLVLTYAGVC
jgi:hypothetical protein